MPIDKEFEVVGIISIGKAPVKISLIRVVDKKHYKLTIGDEFEGRKIIAIKTIERAKFVQCTDEQGKNILIAQKQPDGPPFPAGPLLESYQQGLITTEGKLTPKGKKTISHNLRLIASAGQQHILETGSKTVTHDQIVKKYFPEMKAVAGEDYSKLVVSEQGGTVKATTLFEESVDFIY